MDLKATTSDKPFRLLDLPPELLLAILSYAVVQPTPICLHAQAPSQHNTIDVKGDDPTLPPPTTLKERPWRTLLTPPAITRTNRLLRTEGLRLFYGENAFHGLNWADPRPHEWMRFLPAEARRKGGEKESFLLSSNWEVDDVAAYLNSKAKGFEGRVHIEVASERIVQSLGMACEEVSVGRLFVVRFARQRVLQERSGM